jgi:prolyl 4-hydroxylase
MNLFLFILIIIIFIIIFYLLNNLNFKKEINYISGYTNDDYIYPTIYNNFINKKEAEYIIQNAKNNFEPSMVSSKNGNLDESVRKSKTAWIDKHDPIIKNIILRLCKIVNEPFENTEDLQVVKYDKNGFYKQHYDSCCELSDRCIEFNKYGAQRKITMLIYLNDDFKEGGTYFPKLNKTFKPLKYSGILFYTLGKNSRKCHINSLHAGLPISSGEKYICNIWIREKKF